MKLNNKLSNLERKVKKLSKSSVDFDKYCEVIGFKVEQIDDLNNGNEDLENEACDMMIRSTRKSIALIYFQSLAILSNKLEAYCSGEKPYPTEDIRNLKILFDIYNQSCSYSPLSNIDAAMRTVQAIPGLSINMDKNAIIP